MTKKEFEKIASNFGNVVARILKYFGTASLNSMAIQVFVVQDSEKEFSIGCAGIACMAGAVEVLNASYTDSKKIAKAHKVVLKFERFLDFVLLFRTLYDASYYFLEQKYPAAAISAGITFPFATWRAYKSKRYWIENPITLFLSKKLGESFELNTFPLPRQISHRFSLQGFDTFKRLHNAVIDAENTSQQSNPESLRAYFNTQMARCSFLERLNYHVLMDTLTYGAEISGIVGYTMFLIRSIFEISHPILNFGIAALFFMAGSLAGYRIEKIKDLLLDICTSDFTKDQGLQDNIHDLLVDLYTNVTVNVRRFAKVAEFLKNLLASFMGLSFAYIVIDGGFEVNDYYAIASVFVSILVGINSIYSVARQQDEMLLQTGAKTALEKLESRRSGATVESKPVPSAIIDQTAVAITPGKDEKGKENECIAEQLFVKNDDSSESSANSSDSGSPPKAKSLPTDSPPQSSSPEIGLRVLARSAPTVEDIRIESQQNDVSEQQTEERSRSKGWLDGWFKFGFLSSGRSERVEGLRIPLMPPNERSADPEVDNGMLLKPV